MKNMVQRETKIGRPKNPQMASMDDQTFANLYEKEGPRYIADLLEIPEGTVRQRALQSRRTGIPIRLQPKGKLAVDRYATKLVNEMGGPAEHAPRIPIEINTGTAIIFSDAHYWPGKASTAHRALVKMVHEDTPAALICNGDVVDMASVSRHPPIGWETRPSVQQEIECAQERLHEILRACTKKTKKVWNLGNHDARFETRLASVAPEYAKVAGIHLHDHFPEWDRAWSTWINDQVVIKHRYKGGIHAPHNNTVTSGKTIVTGHLHSAKVTPFTDYNGTRFGVDTGCIADTYGPQFTNYMEDNPRSWISAFGILTFIKGKLLWPELVTVWDKDHVQFRGKLIKV